MMPYDEALKVWASRRFNIPLDKIKSVDLEDVPAEGDSTFYEPAHVRASIWPKDWDDCGWDTNEVLHDGLASVIYEVVHAGITS